MTQEVQTISLDDLIARRSGSVDPSKFPREYFELLSIPAFDVGKPEITIGAAIGSTKQVVQEGDVLLSKIVPHIRRAWVVKPTTNHRLIASGEWIVFRDSRFDPNYLRHLLTADGFHRQFMQTVSGVGGSLLRARPAEVAKIKVSLPPKTEQQRIATILDKVDSLLRMRQQANRLADEFLRAAYIEIFGDPITNPNQWPICELWEVIESTKLGIVRSSEEFGWDLPTPYLRMDAITKDGKILHNKIQGTVATPGEVAEFGLKRGDLLFNTRNSRELVGKTALWCGDDGAVFNNNVMRIRFNELIAPEVVDMQFRLPALARELETRKSGTTSVFAIYFRDLKTLPIQVASKAAQAKFVQIAKRTGAYIAKVDSMTKTSETLSRALRNKLLSDL
jgi:type I restriction enzyme S subunit